MTERLLQYIWQFRHFNLSALQTAENENLSIIHPGAYNRNQGPDFLDARIVLGNTTWAGHIELHVLSSQWKAHGHGSDKNYDNVILHVVWEHDEDLQLPFPTLELQHRVPKLLLNRFAALMQHSGFIACETKAATVDSIIWQAWKARLLAERLAEKSKLVESFLEENNYHWEETCWWLLARSFGAKVNAAAFEAMARSLPVGILAKHKHQLLQLEALLLGQAGLLENDFNEKYPAMLQREFRFLQKKYGLMKISVQLHFLRMRPSNFPTVRLAQLAMLVHQSQNLFSKLKETADIRELRKRFAVTSNDYWHYHYMPDEESRFQEKKLGGQMINQVLINAVIPLLFAYGRYQQDQACRDRLLQWMECLPAENNTITNGFMKAGVSNDNAHDSQALLQLKKNYCDNRRCLDCAIGNKLLKS